MKILDFLTNFWNKYKLSIILGIVAIVSLLLLSVGISKYRALKHQYNNNMKALTEQMEVYETNNGKLVAEKTILEGDLKTLKMANEELYNQVQELKVKPKEVIYIETEVINEVHDTTYVVPEINEYLKKDFDFSNKYRTLSGFIEYDKPNLGLTINQDIVNVDFIVAVKDSKVYVTSNNPYVKYNNIQGVTIPKYRPSWSLGIGPSINFGYDLLNKKPGVMAGIAISLNYNLITW